MLTILFTVNALAAIFVQYIDSASSNTFILATNSCKSSSTNARYSFIAQFAMMKLV